METYNKITNERRVAKPAMSAKTLQKGMHDADSLLNYVTREKATAAHGKPGDHSPPAFQGVPPGRPHVPTKGSKLNMQ